MTASEEPGLGLAAILRAVDVVHPPAIVCARDGRPTVVDDGMVRLELIETAGDWRWAVDDDEGPVPDEQHLFRVLAMLAQAYELEPAQRRMDAERKVEALRDAWIGEALAVPPPRLSGACAPGRPRGTSPRPQVVLYDDPRPLSVERMALEAERLHPAAYVCGEHGWPTLIDDGVSWVMIFDWWDGWRWSLDGEDRGQVRDGLELQVILAERAWAHTAVDEERRRLAAEHVAMLRGLPIAERYQRAREHARARLARTG